MSELRPGDIGGWLEKHHRVEPPSDRTGGEEIHVFAREVGPVFAPPQNEKCYEVSFGLGPVTFKIEVCFDLAAGTFSVCVYVWVPLYGWIKIGCASGSIHDGITISFDVGVVKGQLHFYIKDKWLWLHYDVAVLGKHFVGDIKLIPVPI